MSGSLKPRPERTGAALGAERAIEILVSRDADRRSGPSLYRVANQPVVTSMPIPDLEGFRIPDFPSTGPRRWRVAETPASGPMTFEGLGAVGSGLRHVQCRLAPEGYRLLVEDCGHFFVSRRGDRVVCSVPEGDSGPWVEGLLGPALILALALRGSFCLHASAVTVDGRLAVFVGDSGHGKSTLAALLALQAPGFRRAGDDVLPLSLADAVLGHPWFPQLSLAAGRQPGSALPQALPVGAFFLLAGGRGNRNLDAQPLPATLAAQTLIEKTVASRLFGRDLLERHFDFCSEIAARLPVYRLSYPWGREVMPRLAALVQERLGEGLSEPPNFDVPPCKRGNL